jgi:hypothetical protein
MSTETKLAVKRAIRNAMIRGPLSAKQAATEDAPLERLWKAADPEVEKHLRVFELRSILPGLLEQDPRAAMDFISDVLGLRSLGLIVAQAPKGEGAAAPVDESMDVVEAAADLQAKVRAAVRDGYVDPAERAEIRNASLYVQRHAVEVPLAVDAHAMPQMAMGDR